MIIWDMEKLDLSTLENQIHNGADDISGVLMINLIPELIKYSNIIICLLLSLEKS